ncbi:hypothetical protein ABG768_028201 [Culter alburnus]|uniref:Uncharacterized protein n=1 Tax=Culter alburnus TaxID=194366 RepID=A0AAW1YTK5_CULAL
MRGFLGLGPIGSTSVGGPLPPLTYGSRILYRRHVYLTDTLNPGPVIVGEQLVRILLCDLYQWDEHMPGQSLKGKECPFGGHLVDCRTVMEFSREVVGQKAFRYPLTFGRAVDMVTAMGYDPAHCVSLGLSKYKYFSHIKYWDEQHHLKAWWNTKDYIELYKQTEILSIVSMECPGWSCALSCCQGECRGRGSLMF